MAWYHAGACDCPIGSCCCGTDIFKPIYVYYDVEKDEMFESTTAFHYFEEPDPVKWKCRENSRNVIPLGELDARGNSGIYKWDELLVDTFKWKN